MEILVRAPHGTARRPVQVEQVHIPDLWRMIEDIRGFSAQAFKSAGVTPDQAAEAVLETWHLCHDMLHALQHDGRDCGRCP